MNNDYEVYVSDEGYRLQGYGGPIMTKNGPLTFYTRSEAKAYAMARGYEVAEFHEAEWEKGWLAQMDKTKNDYTKYSELLAKLRGGESFQASILREILIDIEYEMRIYIRALNVLRRKES